MNHWLDWADKKRKEEEEKELVAFWNRMTVGLPLVPQQQEDREDIDCYAQGLIFKNANIIRRHGLFVRPGLKILIEMDDKGPFYYRPPSGTVITKHRMKEID